MPYNLRESNGPQHDSYSQSPRNGICETPRNSAGFPDQPILLVGWCQGRQVPAERKTRPAHDGVAGGGDTRPDTERFGMWCGMNAITSDSNSNSSGTAIVQNQTAPQQAASSTAFDLKALRLPPNYGATLGVKKLLTKVPVGKPRKPQFFRTHADEGMTFPAMLLEQKEARESYLVMPDVAKEISELLRPVQLYTAIDRQNNPFLIPVPLPGEDGNRNPWHESLAQAVEHAKLNWLRISANMNLGGYDVYEAQAALPEPEWSEHGIDDLIQVAFRGKIIDSLEHPVVQSLLGRV